MKRLERLRAAILVIVTFPALVAGAFAATLCFIIDAVKTDKQQRRGKHGKR